MCLKWACLVHRVARQAVALTDLSGVWAWEQMKGVAGQRKVQDTGENVQSKG